MLRLYKSIGVLLASIMKIQSVNLQVLEIFDVYDIKKWPVYCPQGSGTLRQQLLHGIALYCIVLHGTAWYCLRLHCIAWYCMVLHNIA